MDAHSAWLDERRTGIGGSDVAAILGLSKWRTPYDVFRDKRGELIEQVDNDAMRWGRNLEPVVRQEYADQTGREVLLPTGILRSERHPFMIANLDGYTVDNRVVEIKTAKSGKDWGEPGSDQIPQAYLFQVQHYMAVTGFDVADVAVLIAGSDFRIYTVEADRELHEMLVEAEALFWRRVLDDDPPEPISFADAVSRWGRSSASGSIVADQDVEAAAVALAQATSEIKRMESIADDLKAKIMIAMGDADTLVDSSGKVIATWKLPKSTQRFDVSAFKVAHPEVYANFLKSGEASRRFLLK